MSTAIRAHQITATEAQLIEAHDAQCTDSLCGRAERFGGVRHVFQCAQLSDIPRQVIRMREQYRAQTPAIGDTVEYHGSATEAHGRYVVLGLGHDQWGRPTGYDLSDGTRRLHQVRRESITRMTRPQPQAPEPQPQGQASLF